MGLYHHIYWQLLESPVCGGFVPFVALSWGMWGISRWFILIQVGGDHSRKDFWVHLSTLEWTEVFTSICGIRFIVIEINTSVDLGRWFKKANAVILRCWWLFVCCSIKATFLNVADNYNLWNVMTKIALKVNCGDSNLPILAENLQTIFGECFRPPI